MNFQNMTRFKFQKYHQPWESWDLKSLVVTGDPKEPEPQEESQPPKKEGLKIADSSGSEPWFSSTPRVCICY